MTQVYGFVGMHVDEEPVPEYEKDETLTTENCDWLDARLEVLSTAKHCLRPMAVSQVLFLRGMFEVFEAY